MKLLRAIKILFLWPIWIWQIGTSAKSFLDNPILGSPVLNRLGLHVARVRLAAFLARWRRRRLAAAVPSPWREAFDRDGFVVVANVLPAEEFATLREAILSYPGRAREMIQGDAVTRRLAVEPEMLQAIPALRELLKRQDLRALFHYVASFRVEPLHYIQTIVTHVAEGASRDPQEALHADSFHSSLKAWLFLNPVHHDESPFVFVPGSHRVSDARLAWEHRRSTAQPRLVDRLSARGSPRVSAEDIAAMDLTEARNFAVPANTLIVADTIGFHARGLSVRSTERVEIWSYARRNPFLPWLGGDPLSVPGLAERRVIWLWAIRDRFERWVGQPWKPVGIRMVSDKPHN